MACCFPEGIIFEILTRVPAKDLLRFKIVCKPWYFLITDLKFAKSHLARAGQARQEFIFNAQKPSGHPLLAAEQNYISINAQNLSVQPELPLALEYIDDFLGPLWLTSSCHGLLLFRGPWSLYNPVTRKYMYLPELGCSDACLVYDNSIDMYKIFAIGNSRDKGFMLTLEGHTSQWRDLDESLVDRGEGYLLCSDILYTGNELHWVVSVFTAYEVEIGNYMFSMDVRNEKITKMQVPTRQAFAGQKKRIYPSELKRSLCLTIISNDYIEILILEKKGTKCQWTTSYSINLNSIPNKPAFLKNFLFKETNVLCVPSCESGNAVDLVKVFVHHGDQFFFYNLKTHDLKQIGVVNSELHLGAPYAFHTNSLVSCPGMKSRRYYVE